MMVRDSGLLFRATLYVTFGLAHSVKTVFMQST